MEGVWREIKICLNSEEYTALKNRADQLGLTVPQYIKEVAIEFVSKFAK